MPRDKVRPWTWNASRELAAQLVADKQLTNFEIAKRAGVSDSQLNRWKLAPEFASRVTEHVATFRARITTTGLARRENRIAAKKARAAALRRVIRQRAEAYGHGEPQYNPVREFRFSTRKRMPPSLFRSLAETPAWWCGSLARPAFSSLSTACYWRG